MRKTFKKLMALAMAGAMTLSMGMTTLAGEPEAATISQQTVVTILKGTNEAGDPSANTYKAYKIADFTVSGNVYVDVKLNETFKDVSVTFDGTTYTITDGESLMKALGGKGDEHKLAQQFATAFAAKITNQTIAAATSENETITLDTTGYYLLVESSHGNDVSIETRYILVAAAGDAKTVNLKTSKPTIQKKIILEDSTKNVADASVVGSRVDTDVVAIGDTVTYEITATIPSYPADVTGNVMFKITDVMSKGLTYVDESAIVTIPEVSNVDATCSIEKSNTTGDTTVTIAVPSNVVKANGGKVVTVILEATLNEYANVGAIGNPNSVDLTYTNHWTTQGEPDGQDTTDEDTVITYTGELNIFKVDGDDKTTALSGAEFKIMDGDQTLNFVKVDKEGKEAAYRYVKEASADSVTTVTTGSNGEIYIMGLDNGSYTAIETKAPAGYNTDSTPQPITLKAQKDTVGLEKSTELVAEDNAAQNGSVANTSIQNRNKIKWTVGEADKLTIENKQGLTLPGTGGIGTTIFTFGGLALVLLAAIMFVVYMHKQKREA